MISQTKLNRKFCQGDLHNALNRFNSYIIKTYYYVISIILFRTKYFLVEKESVNSCNFHPEPWQR